MLHLPPIPELAQFNWERMSQQWSSLTVQTKKIADGAGQGEEFKALEQQINRYVMYDQKEKLKQILIKRKGVRVLTQLWIDKEDVRKASLNEETIDYIQAKHPKLGMSSLMNLISLVYRYFDALVDGNIFNRLTQWLNQQIEQRLKDRKNSSDTILSVLNQAKWLFDLTAPKALVNLAKQNHLDLTEQLKKLRLNELPQGRFLDICHAQYYLDTLREIPVGEQHDVLHELLKHDVATMPFEEGKRIGHIALEIIIDRSAGAPSEIWQNFVLNLAGDPRIANTATNYRQWWKPIGENRVKAVTSWLAKEDLRLFLGAIEEYANYTGDEALNRMFPARKRFLEGLYEHGFVRNARLMLGNQAEHTVKRVLGKSLTTSYINLRGMTQTSIIYLDCGDFHIIEGSHNFKLWIYMGLPSEKLNDYSLSELNHFALTNSFPQEYKKNYPKGELMPIQHSPTSWQKNAIDFLTQNGIELDLEKLFYKDEYRRYISRYGLPVVRKVVEEKNLLEINLLNALEVYQPITAKELVKVLNSEFNMKADRSTVNSKLYSMLSENRVTRDDRLCWELA
ncbi:EH signature domain-containing protein [Pseudoalteromonas sp. APM04]|uniref:EH signature domain-containing protein n=1 Tax=Pseudoalteromonas sp. APM04 TaxID=2699396 RepID=UPI001FB369D3|nr:EH signature domain-containing protein [Pseudoalteromonas sp. APM04]UOB72459.1 EH signature domain-containing protein [Pseudoalteromonas sp. APM04]